MRPPWQTEYTRFFVVRDLNRVHRLVSSQGPIRSLGSLSTLCREWHCERRVRAFVYPFVFLTVGAAAREWRYLGAMSDAFRTTPTNPRGAMKPRLCTCLRVARSFAHTPAPMRACGRVA